VFKGDRLTRRHAFGKAATIAMAAASLLPSAACKARDADQGVQRVIPIRLAARDQGVRISVCTPAARP